MSMIGTIIVIFLDINYLTEEAMNEDIIDLIYEKMNTLCDRLNFLNSLKTSQYEQMIWYLIPDEIYPDTREHIRAGSLNIMPLFHEKNRRIGNTCKCTDQDVISLEICIPLISLETLEYFLDKCDKLDISRNTVNKIVQLGRFDILDLLRNKNRNIYLTDKTLRYAAMCSDP